ncbi:glycosyltransferase family 1 protein [Pedobacter sp. SYP-B3415]|uniref:glycosyltransferase family 1 protein n=1 Tax=Pedobacter sp. SYP-B3415 TaxID=2496641 RepID=UPI00101C3A6C|nr:glycosyltransferase family 1 protein [Pedobacter sp. SYP-B3415]
MKTLKIIDWPEQRFYGDSHPLHRWRKLMTAHDVQVEFFNSHLDPALDQADYLLIHSRYFKSWQHLQTRNAENEERLLRYLEGMRSKVGRLIWFDAADSSGSADLGLFPFVDLILKKQLLKDRSYYTGPGSRRDLRIWLNKPGAQPATPFQPCTPTDLPRLRLAWNLGLNDYRYYAYKTSRLSNVLSRRLYPDKVVPVFKTRIHDLAFRGTLHADSSVNQISAQRNTLLQLLGTLGRNVVTGKYVGKAAYLRELRNSKVSISPYGWGEICYRDFETFLAGSLLIKPDMGHLETFPDLFIANQTYLPVSWNLTNLPELIDCVLDNYNEYRHIAHDAQDHYRQQSNDGIAFVQSLLKNIE